MRFVTTYQKGTSAEIAALATRKRFQANGMQLHHRACATVREHPEFLQKQLQKGEPVTWVSVGTQFNGYPDSLTFPSNYDIIATEAEERQTLHPDNIKLDPFILFPNESTHALLNTWINACEHAHDTETFLDVLKSLIRQDELARLGADLALLPTEHVNRCYAVTGTKRRKQNKSDEPSDHLPLALTCYREGSEVSKAVLNIQQMNAESLGLTLIGAPTQSKGSLKGAFLLSGYLEEHEQPVYAMPAGLSLKRIPWFLFTTVADLVLVGKPSDLLTFTHAYVDNSVSARFLLKYGAEAEGQVTNEEFAALHPYAMIKIVEIPDVLFKEIFTETK